MSYQSEQERTFRFLRLPSEARRRRVRPLIGWLRRLAPVLGLVVAATSVLVWARTAPAFALAELQIRTGERVETAQVERRLAELRGRNLFRVDLRQVSDLLLEESWIRELRVVKQLPNRLLIAVEEHEPVAILRQVAPEQGQAATTATRVSDGPGPSQGPVAAPDRWYLDRAGARIAPAPEGEGPDLLVLAANHHSQIGERATALGLVEQLGVAAGTWHRRGLESVQLVSTGDLELRFRGRDYPLLVAPASALVALGNFERLERPLRAHGVVPRSVDLRFEGRVLVTTRESKEVG